MKPEFDPSLSNIIESIIKVAIPSLLLGAAKLVVMVNDKKISISNAVISYLVGVVLATTICYNIKDVISPVWLFALNSVITLAGVNIMRSLIYKKDWNLLVDSLVKHIFDWIKSKFK